MAQQDRTTIKATFETGDVPTQAEFEDLIDSQFNFSDDTIDDIPEGTTHKKLTAAQQAQIHDQNSDTGTSNSDWSINTGGFTAKFLTVLLTENANYALPDGGGLLARTSDLKSDAQIKTAYENNANTNEFNDTEKTKLGNIETAADVTDATNVAAAGATMNSDTSLAGNGYFIDEDAMTSNDATKVPSQQSVKAYVDTQITTEKSYQGGYDATGNSPDLDSTPIAGILKGDVYDVTVAGNFFTEAVEIGDTLRAKQDSPTLLSHWVIVQSNLNAASIKTQYESNANTNEFNDTEKTKLGNIENNATADQTGAEIKLAYEGEANTNAFTDTEKTKLGNIAANATQNDTDANLKDRANHTGTQLAATISDFASTVRSTVLTGLSLASSAAVVAADSVLVAIGKLQKQITDLTSKAEAAEFVIAASDETTFLVVGGEKVKFRMPFGMNLTEVKASVSTAPTDATLIVDINEGGTSIMTTNKLQILTTATIDDGTATITDAVLAEDAEISIDVDQIGSTIAGAGLKVTLIGTRI